MSTNSINDFAAKVAKFDAYKKYLQQNAKVLGIENKPLFEQLNRYQVDSNFKKGDDVFKTAFETIYGSSGGLTGMAEQKLPKTPAKNTFAKIGKFFKAHGGAFALVGLVAAGVTALAVALKKNKDEVPQETAPDNVTPVVPSDSTATAPTDTIPAVPIDSVAPVQRDSVPAAPIDSVVTVPRDSVPAVPQDSVAVAPKDSTAAVPPQNEEVHEVVEEKTAEEDAPVAKEEAEKATEEEAEEVAADETEESEEVAEDETDEVVDEEENPEVKEEQESTQKPMGLSKSDGLTVAQLKGEIHENIVQNRYLRREIRLNHRYERRIGAPNEARPSDEEMREQINANKNETKLYRQQIRDIRRAERQERKLERQAHRDIRKIEYKAKQDANKLLNAAAQARKSGLEINETKLENDVENIKVTAKTQTDDIYAQTEQTIEQGRLALKA